MKHPSNVSTCGICKANSGEVPVPGGIIFENDLWLVRHLTPWRCVPGWMMVQSQRHVAGISDFNDAEAANFGPAFRHLQKVLQDVTGALRIYTASMNESSPHFHCHLVPRYVQMSASIHFRLGNAVLVRRTLQTKPQEGTYGPIRSAAKETQ